MRSSLLLCGAERGFLGQRVVRAVPPGVEPKDEPVCWPVAPGASVGVAPAPHWKYVSFVPETIERCEARAAL
jgi:hypothetical protein